MKVLPATFVPGFHDEEAAKKMVYKKLGNTDMVVSKLALGGGPFGELYGEIENVSGIVREALTSGINYIDTAYYYGQGKSEKRLGEALSTVPRSAYYIATKVGRYEREVDTMFDFSADKVVRAFEQSLQRLRLSYVDVIQIHDIEFCSDENIIINETLPALQKLCEQGKARYIGVTGYPVSKLLSVIQKSQVKIDVVLSYCRATLCDQTLSDFIPEFQARGLGIINASVTSMGLFSQQGPPEWHPATTQLRDATAAAIAYCQDEGVDISTLAAFYSINFPGVHTTLGGANKVAYVRKALQTVWNPLTLKEQKCLDHIINTYFKPLGNAHWEGIEIERQNRQLLEHGINRKFDA